ncbi:MAG: thioredoxin family protein [Gammaproteobacteria bacterium]|nr:thioredoxin family protein [Gammaproteobacteria bacterium]
MMLLVFSASVFALEKEPFSYERFEALQKSGEVVLIDIHADWCPTCARQTEQLSKYQTENPDKQFHILQVNFDDQKEVVRHFRAPRQSTLLIYKGDEQFWYSVAETRYEEIAAQLDRAIEFGAK